MSSARASRLLWVSALLCSAASIPCFSQLPTVKVEKLLPDPAPSASADVMPSLTISKRVNEVNLIFTVADKRGRFVSSLTSDEVKVLDNHLPPEAVTYFQAQTDLPLRVALLVDTSDSITGRFSFEQAAASTFLQKSLRPQADAGMVIGFDSQIHLYQSITGNVDLLTQAVHSLKTGGRTVLYDAVRDACDKLRGGSDQPVRRAIILISDGMDNGSSARLEDAVEAALRAEVAIFALSTNPPSLDDHPGTVAMKRLTSPTGGRVLAASRNREIAHAFASIQEQLHNQYAIGYRPAELKIDGQYRSIELTTHAKHKYRAFYRKGYYADVR